MHLFGFEFLPHRADSDSYIYPGLRYCRFVGEKEEKGERNSYSLQFRGAGTEYHK